MNAMPLEPVAVVGVGAILPDAPDAGAFWDNVKGGRYSISGTPADRWDPDLYYDPDPRAPDKTYSRIGGWVREYPWDPMGWRLAVPPTVAAQLDIGQKWAVGAGREALLDAGWPGWSTDPERVAVIIGNAIGGEKHYQTNLRIEFPELERELRAAPSFGVLPPAVRAAVLAEVEDSYKAKLPPVTEDTMPGELANIIAGRVANLFNFRGPNFTTDAACASGLAALTSAVRGLQVGDFDVALSGGVDRNMGVSAFVKFCKIGALSATGTRPFDAGADGFVMGEGAALFVLKRLSDAERDGDRVYAVLLGLAGASDGKGKGITAPNPIGQRLAIERAWAAAGLDPACATYVEAHGTSTRVGDATELGALSEVFQKAGPGAIALGSVKSNFGHLKAAAGAAGLLKTVLSLRDGLLVPSLHFHEPNPNVDWSAVPFRVNTELRDWRRPSGGVRSAGVSAFGFGGTNFHVVLEEYVPGRHRAEDAPRSFAGAALPPRTAEAAAAPRPAAEAVPPYGAAAAVSPGTSATTTAPAALATAAGPLQAAKAPLRGVAVVGGADEAEVIARLERLEAAPAPTAPDPALAGAALRVAIDYTDRADLANKAARAVAALRKDDRAMWRMLRAKGVFAGRGPAPKVAFLYTGQGSQYVDMLRGLRESEPIVAATFDEADRIMTPLLGRPLTSYIFSTSGDTEALERLLLQTEITQPAVLTVDAALTRLLAAYGVRPDLVMGHSLGEYGALVAAGSLTFEAALEAVSARGHEMASLSLPDNGAMAAVLGPLEEIGRVVAAADGYVVIANINSTGQAVVGGATPAVRKIVETFRAAGMTAMPIPVSHAFHTSIVAPASEPLKTALRRLDVRPPSLPIVANVTGEFYPADAGVETMLDILGRQVASPVQFVTGLRTLYDAGARVFVEVGPKKALHGFAEDVLGTAHDDVLTLFTNHPKTGEVASFNQALCGLYAAGLAYPAPGTASTPAHVRADTPAHIQASTPAHVRASAPAHVQESTPAHVHESAPAHVQGSAAAHVQARGPVPAAPLPHRPARSATMTSDTYAKLGRLFTETLEQGLAMCGVTPDGVPAAEPVVVTGAALGLPGTPRVFDDENLSRILDGQQFIDTIPHRLRRAMVDRHITRLVKRESGDPTFEAIDSEADVVKLAGRNAPLDVVAEFGVDAARDAALDVATRLAIGAGFDALRDAGVPLVMHYKTTTLGTRLPDRWGLPDALRDDTGVIFASAFPGYDAFAGDLERYYTDRARREQLLALEAVRSRMRADEPATAEVDRRIGELRDRLRAEPYAFDRRFLFRCLSMGHSQFAEIIGARGPNTQVNAACASTTQAVGLAEDWIRAGRCRRVIVVSADDATSDTLLPWIGSGFLASGAAATDDLVEDAATPFDRRRHGMIVGAGAAAIVVESAAAARERGLRPICEVLGTVTANSAFHGTRLDVEHIEQVMERVVRQAESHGIDRYEIAPETVFVSHETYTPARGGSAAAEISALRHAFGTAADSIVVTNTKGFTGHAMGAGIEDVVAIKALETGIVPPVPNFKEPDPELGPLNLSAGGTYPVRYALRLAAGFGSQIAMTLMRWTPMPDGRRRRPGELGYAYRIDDHAAWQRWIAALGGRPDAPLEVVQRRLRLDDGGAPAPAAALASSAAAPAATYAAPPAMAPAAAPPVGPPAPASAVALAAPAATLPAAAAIPRTSYLAGPERRTTIPATPAPPDRAPAATSPAARAFAASSPAPPLTTFPQAGVPAAPEPPAHAEAAPPADEVAGSVVEIVSEMTGYPPELLEPDLDLEADLGVDTVKQAEIFAAVRERYALQRDPDMRLRDFPTLDHVIGWIRDRLTPALDGPGETAEIPSDAPAPVGGDASGDGTPEPADEVAGSVVEIVSEMTGYPPELLEPDLDLEADLGVDTVKQAEIFAAVRERYALQRDPDMRLRDFPTLDHVIGWIRDRLTPAAPAVEEPAPAPRTAAPAEEKPAPAPRTAAPAEEEPAPAPQIIAPGDAVAEGEKAPDAGQAAGRYPRRVPVPVLRPAIAVCAPTGVTLAAGARVVVARDTGGVGKALTGRLEKLGCDVLTLDPAAPADELTGHLDAWLADGGVHGVYWLPALDDEGATAAMDLAGWREATRRRVKNLYAVVRRLCARSPFLVTGTRLGGYHGYDEAGATAPLGGAVTGFAKAYRRETPDALVKAVDFATGRKTGAIADMLIEETLRDPGCVEVGRADGLRWTVGLEERAWHDDGGDRPGLALGPDSVFVVTGAAGGIVSAITADLAAAAPGVFHLLDLTAEPDPGDPELRKYATDHEGLKADIALRLKQEGKRPTPVLIEHELAHYERLDAALAAVRAVERAGGTARYHQVDLTDPGAVERIVDQVRATSGHVDVLVHAAGVEVSRSLADKRPGEFDLVFDVKSDGWFNLMRAIGDMPVAATVAFGSVAGRFGNAGQTDYSAANDLLCKAASGMRRTRPGTRAIVLDWTAWAGIGMATRGSIPKIMEMAGIETLAPEVGVPWVRGELTRSADRGEVLVAGALGLLGDEAHPTGGLDLDAFQAAGAAEAGPMAGTAEAYGVYSGLTTRVTLDPKRQPFLDHHRIDGVAVLPGVMGIEAFAEAARLAAPGLRVTAVEDVDFLAPVKFYRDEPRTLTVRATVHRVGGDLLARCVLSAERPVPGSAVPRRTVHFTGAVRLSRAAPAPDQEPPVEEPGTTMPASEVYRVFFHGPAYQVVASAWSHKDGAAATMAAGLPPDRDPATSPMVTDPRLIELCFQTAALSQAARTGRMALPLHVDRVTVYRDEAAGAGPGVRRASAGDDRGDGRDAGQDAGRDAGPVRAVVTADGDRFACAVLDAEGRVLTRVDGYRGTPVPGELPAEQRAMLTPVA
ncbi:SDR family NAD(P)-dependent oxidoreductase [Sphaerisporangium dianthi]|uniref:SDR family NAD(P)-dependent oxidoreductase n=1 Tax=Sphaerisporangium dianthi TaxID=1436120 RepID=A0ABV9CLI2_9ACTN